MGDRLDPDLKNILFSIDFHGGIISYDFSEDGNRIKGTLLKWDKFEDISKLFEKYVRFFTSLRNDNISNEKVFIFEKIPSNEIYKMITHTGYAGRWMENNNLLGDL